MFFFGSRRLSPAHSQLAFDLGVLFAGRGDAMVVGCAQGADTRFIAGVLSAGGASRLVVNAVGGSDGSGFVWPGSFPVLVAAADAGAVVNWWAGGPASASVVARLRGRTIAGIASAVGFGVGIFATPNSRGSGLSVRQLRGRGLPVYCWGSVPPAFPWRPARSAVFGDCWAL